ncbi:MAG: FadR/GntR family transcriptional regulator [Pyrinomonadaceae bacterium]
MLNLIVDKNHFTGVQSQIANQIAVLIRSGMIKPKEILPGEETLGEHLNVSRAVVREAYKILKGKKLISSDRRRRTFVVDNPSKEGFPEYLRVQLPANLKEKIDVATLFGKINPNSFIERELSQTVNKSIADFLLSYQAIND